MSILQTILNKAGGQVTEDYFRNQLIQELGSTNFDSDAADTGGFAPGQLYFFTYQAQTKQPYYDMFPLSYVIDSFIIVFLDLPFVCFGSSVSLIGLTSITDLRISPPLSLYLIKKSGKYLRTRFVVGSR